MRKEAISIAIHEREVKREKNPPRLGRARYRQRADGGFDLISGTPLYPQAKPPIEGLYIDEEGLVWMNGELIAGLREGRAMKNPLGEDEDDTGDSGDDEWRNPNAYL